MKTALITGITGQDGSHLTEFLVSKGYKVYGMYRRTSLDVFDRIEHIKDKVTLIEGDMTDTGSIIRILQETKPDEVYNLAAQSFVAGSWTQAESTGDITGLGVLRILESIKLTNPKIKFYQASSSEMFGKVQENPQTETTPLYPRSPYGVAKVYGHYITINYRESYNLFACSGILFNHEGERRGKQFVTRKITHSVAKIIKGKQEEFSLGNLDAKRDWGYAGDYVKAMWLMLQQEKPDDYVICTGETHTVREFVEESFKAVDKQIIWEGSGLDEIGKVDGIIRVRINEKFYRPAEVDILLGDCSKAKKNLGWEPQIKFEELVKLMVKSDLELVQ